MVNRSTGLDTLFHALADPTRRTMLERLTAGPATVSELARPLPMSMPAVLGHLRQLEDSGLVRSTKRGRVRTCTLVPDALSPAERWFAERRSVWEHRLDRLGQFLDDTAEPLPAGLQEIDHPDATASPERPHERPPVHPTSTRSRP